MDKNGNSEKLVERILANVDVMRGNAEEMRIWKNLPLAKETFALIKQVGDDEGPLGRAMGCEMVVEKFSEYDAPRFTLEMLRYELQQLQMSEEKSDDLTEEDVLNHIAELERFIDIGRVSYAEYKKQSSRHLEFDEIERTSLWEEINQEVEEETDKLLGDEPRGMGFCFGYWSAKRGVLAKRGIEWKDPHQMNPGVMFD
ncbi:MAG: hypothetical protein IJ057_00980 [Bacteroidales bacterium]|nr:hypothetical protein [Bacteroidales bacterium]